MTDFKMILLGTALSLSLAGCGRIPEPPAVWKCGHSVKFNKFRCVNTKTKDAVNVSRNSSQMEAAQCLSADDYKTSERYVSELIKLAEARCK